MRIMASLTLALRLAVGAALIAMGRRLYWLFVAAVGFLIGLRGAETFLDQAPNWMHIALALIAGLLGAGFAVLVQRFGIILAGAIAGAFLANAFLEFAGLGSLSWRWVVYLVAALLGALLLSLLFDWALIVLSSIFGSALIVQALELAAPWNIVLFLSALIAGLLLQGWGFRVPRRAETTP